MKAQLIALVLSFISLVSASQAATPAFGAWTQEKQGQLDYWIYRPNSANGRGQSSLMVSLHGCAQTANDFRRFANWEQAAEEHRMTVVLPLVLNGGVYFGCWDYYGREHTQSNKSNGPLIALTESLLQRSELRLNAKKVFVSGLSSGSAQAMILACLRPDLFRGLGLAAGPVLGSGITDLYAAPRITGAEAAQLCRDLAGTRSPFFAHQITSIIFDERDSSVSPMHSALALEAMSIVYGGTLKPITLDLSTLAGLNTSGKGTLLVDSQSRARVSYIMNAGLGHAWPAGAETANQNGNRYINPKSINYPAYLSELFN